MSNKTMYKMPSQIRLNEISRPLDVTTSAIDHHQSGYHSSSSSCHHLHMTPSTIIATATTPNTGITSTSITGIPLPSPSPLPQLQPPTTPSTMIATTTSTASTSAMQQQISSGPSSPLILSTQQSSLTTTTPLQTPSSPSSNSCSCSHHYHYIHHHLAANGPSSPHYQHPHHSHHSSIQSSMATTNRSTIIGEDKINTDRQISGETHVAVTVHHHHQQQHQQNQQNQQNPKNQHNQMQQSKSEQSLHQYQALDDPNDELESCDCNQSNHDHPSGRSSSRLVSADEIIPSGSEDNNMIRKCTHRKSNKNRLADQTKLRHGNNIGVGGVSGISGNGIGSVRQKRSSVDDTNYNSSRIEVYSDGADSGVKVTDGGTSEEDQGPPLPPRPPPRPRNVTVSGLVPHSTGVKKYVVWCLICGGFSCLLGIMFLGVYFLLRSYTSTVGYFETVPTFVPATLLILTGLCIMSLARRRNRYSYLIKVSGACGLVSALTCALVTVTTTVLHMSRLQALRECEYTQKTRTCTCYSDIDSQVERVDDGVRLVFDSTTDCGVVHGSLYSCLRAIFGLSVAGVLVAVFSCMLVYQLLSHERKKMYWEQLELRCRSLYASQQGPSHPGPPPNGATMIGTSRGNICRCCEQCHAHRQSMTASSYPWDASSDNRFWAATGQPPGNFYSPNPGGDDLTNGNNSRSINQANQRNRATGWSWPRMPWQRNTSDPNSRYRQTPSSPDSQYGFSSSEAARMGMNSLSDGNNMPPPVPPPNQQQGFNVIGSLPYGVWGPPPPYSDPNSPARRGRYQYINPNQCQQIMEHQIPQTHHQPQIPNMECHQHSSSTDSHSHTMEPFCSQQPTRNVIKRQSGTSGFKTKDNYENTPSDSDGPRDRFSNTLPIRKTKKRVEIGAKSIGPNSQNNQRVNVQNVFTSIHQSHMDEHEYHEPLPNQDSSPNTPGQSCQHKLKRLKTGVENSAFQNGENSQDCDNVGRNMEPTESEVYFADVSSCCNISVKNDNYYDEANQRRSDSSKDSNQHDENEDYLAQRFGQRENSIRSRLPFPQIRTEDFNKAQMNLPMVAPRQSLMQKDISRQSMCSIESGEKTDFTDLSPATPCANFNPNNFSAGSSNKDESTSSTFVASFPYSSNEQSQEAHRRSTKNLPEVFLAPDAQYEIIKETTQYESSPLQLTVFEQDITYNNGKSSHFHKPKSPKSLNLTPIKRPSLGTNITSIIQNLGNSEVGLLYPDSRLDNVIDLTEKPEPLAERQSQHVNNTTIENEWSDSSDRRL